MENSYPHVQSSKKTRKSGKSLKSTKSNSTDILKKISEKLFMNLLKLGRIFSKPILCTVKAPKSGKKCEKFKCIFFELHLKPCLVDDYLKLKSFRTMLYFYESKFSYSLVF